MFFDAVVGNPPYQVVGSGDNKNFATPIYHEFIKIAYNQNLTAKASLIHPARFLFNAGATPGDFAEKFLQDEHVTIEKYFPNSQDVFPTSDIKGGVAITLYDSKKTFEPIGTFIPFEELHAIHKKAVLDNKNFRPLSEIIYSRKIFKLTEKFYQENTNAPTYLRDKNSSTIGTNAFTEMPEYFSDNAPNDEHDYVKILGLIKMQRVYKWIRRDYVNSPEPMEKFKVFVPASNGSGALGEVVSTPLVGTPLVGTPLVGCTETFITVGAFDSELEARACYAYIKSKFCRAMLGILKVTQHNTRETWAKVPLQDFNPATSDIDWSGDVDAQLYRKYGLDAAEIEFIESHVKAME